jgi:hypothetical protein
MLVAERFGLRMMEVAGIRRIFRSQPAFKDEIFQDSLVILSMAKLNRMPVVAANQQDTF